MTHRNHLAQLLVSTVCLITSPTVLSQRSGISGYEGTLNAIDVSSLEYWTSNVAGSPRQRADTALTGITWSESGDRPCSLTALGNFIDPSFTLPTPVHVDDRKLKLALCGGAVGNTKTVKFSNPRHFVQGVAVCTNDRRDSAKARLKGIRIYGAAIRTDGTVVALNAEPEHNQHTNCDKEWHPVVMCPADQLVTGLNIYSKTSAGNKVAFAGLGLTCSKPVRPH